ncbi:MAG: HepT-like ribonuclease domain-containing protein [Thermoplasmata archaeon]
MHRDDAIRVRHMLDAAKEAMLFAKNKKRKDLDNDRMLVLSVIKSIEIIGEAAAKVTNETKDRCTEVPWSNIVAMRNRLIHVYFDIDNDRVWDTVTKDLPMLISLLEKIVPPNEKI